MRENTFASFVALSLSVLTLPVTAVPARAQTWAVPIVSNVAYYSERASTLVDLDRDGNPDVVSVDGSALAPRLAYQYGDGTGRFGPRQFASTAILATGVVSADLDSDGYPDLVISGPVDACVHFGSALGVPGPAVWIPGILSPVVVDIDRDNCLDLVGSESGVATCKVLFGNGHRGFSRTAILSLSPSFLPSQAFVLDLDGDGGDEVVFQFGNSVGYYLQVLGSNGGANLVLEPSVLLGTVGVSRGAVADWDGDGAPDLLLPRGGSYAPNEIQIVRHQLRTIVALDTITSLPLPTPSAPRQVFVSDLDGDGIQDLLCPCTYTDMRTARGLGNGAVAAWVAQTGHPVSFPRLVDVTRDGVADLVQTSSSMIETHVQNGTSHPGAVAFGFGTEPCLGAITLGVDSSPTPGNTTMRLRFANAPAFARGLVFGGGPEDLQGYPHPPGVLLHTGMLLSITLGMGDVDGSGVLTMQMPVPNVPGLQGTAVYVQGVFRSPSLDGQLCGGAAIGLVSSRGLAVTVQ